MTDAQRKLEEVLRNLPQVEYDKSSRELPKGVYREKGGSYSYKIWSAKNPTFFYKGGFKTPEAAEYARRCAIQGHHWEGEEHDPANMWGFIYLIEHKKSGKKYVGRKQYRIWNGPQGGYKCTNPQDSEWFEESMWAGNDWEFYRSSCKPLAKAIDEEGPENFTFTVLSVHQDKLELHLAEVTEMIERDVLEAIDDKGEYLYWNQNIASQEFRAPFKKAEMLRMQEEEKEKMKRYYLRPSFCPRCGAMIPYKGEHVCS